MSAGEADARPSKADYEKVLDKADAAVAKFEVERETGVKRLQNALHSHPTAIPGVVLVVSIVFFALVIGQRFLDPFNFSLIVQQVMIIGIVGVAQTLVVLTAGIDLSVGAVVTLSGVIAALLMDPANGGSIPLALLAVFAAAIAVGLVNGLLIVRYNLPPFLATLGMTFFLAGVNLYLMPVPGGKIAESFQDVAATRFRGQIVALVGGDGVGNPVTKVFPPIVQGHDLE